MLWLINLIKTFLKVLLTIVAAVFFFALAGLWGLIPLVGLIFWLFDESLGLKKKKIL